MPVSTLSIKRPLPLCFTPIKHFSELTCFKSVSQHHEWMKAMMVEYQTLTHNNTWALIPLFPNINVVGCKWVFHLKHKLDGQIDKYKARLVPKGFHQ